jgi:CBS domain-containing protein
MRTVKEVMSRDVEVARPDMTVKEAAERMKVRDIGSLPVCKNNRVIGVITDRDITVRVSAAGRAATATNVSDVMTDKVFTVNENAALEEAERIMHDEQIRRLPVVRSDGELVGYLSQAKVARTEGEVQAGRVLKGISQPTKPEPLEPDLEGQGVS